MTGIIKLSSNIVVHSMKRCLPVILLSCILAVVSCEEEPIYEDLNGSENLNRTIKFDVSHVYDTSPYSDSTVAGATIKIYAQFEDLLTDYYPDASRITDSLGHAEINGLDEDMYYIKCTHPTLGELIDSVTTPAYTTSFVELIYFM